MLDRARDLLQKLDEVTRCRFTTPVSTAERLLATAAWAVERIPVLQRGERRETVGLRGGLPDGPSDAGNHDDESPAGDASLGQGKGGCCGD